MPTLITSVVVQRPPQEVFDYLTDVSRHGEWSPKPYRVEGEPGTLTKGTKFSSVGYIPGDKEHCNEVEVTECDPPSRVTWETNEKEGHFVNTFVLTTEGMETKVERTFVIPKPKGVMAALFPVFLPLYVKPQVEGSEPVQTADGERRLKTKTNGPRHSAPPTCSGVWRGSGGASVTRQA